MRNVVRGLSVIGLLGLSSSCVSYSGVTRSPDGQLYISGGTSYFFYSSPWVKRCAVDGTKLNCEELSESPPKGKGAPASGGNASPPAPAAAAAASPPPASTVEPTLTPEPAAAPAKVKKHK